MALRDSSHNELKQKTTHWHHPRAFFLQTDRASKPPATVFIGIKVKSTVELNVKSNVKRQQTLILWYNSK